MQPNYVAQYIAIPSADMLTNENVQIYAFSIYRLRITPFRALNDHTILVYIYTNQNWLLYAPRASGLRHVSLAKEKASLQFTIIYDLLVFGQNLKDNIKN